jgi:uncharacterized membrane protein
VTRRPAAGAALALLVLLGVAAAALRARHPSDLGARMEPGRTRVMRALGLSDPDKALRAAEVARFDSNFAVHPGAALLHVVPGGLFLALAPLQFSARIRARHARVHRLSGRVLVAAGLVSAASGFYFGLLMPFAGPPEAAAIAVFGVLFALALVRGVLAIRRGDPAAHREWMIRALAVALGISTVRLFGIVLDLALSPAGVPPATVFVGSLWLGWLATVVAAEAWIRRTRPGAASAPVLAEA